MMQGPRGLLKLKTRDNPLVLKAPTFANEGWRFSMLSKQSADGIEAKAVWF